MENNKLEAVMAALLTPATSDKEEYKNDEDCDFVYPPRADGGVKEFETISLLVSQPWRFPRRLREYHHEGFGETDGS